MSGKDCTLECDKNATFSEAGCCKTNERGMSPEGLAKLMGKVAENYLVMKNIFGHLSSYDKWQCSGVNRFWKSIVEDMKVWYYQIELEEVVIWGQHKNAITLSKAYADNHTLIFSSVQTLRSLKEFLQTIPPDCEVRLVEKALRDPRGWSSMYPNFFSKIGRFVTDRHVRMKRIVVPDFCLELSLKFPNLRKLDLSGAFLCSGDDEGDDYTPVAENQFLENLREITMARLHCVPNTVIKLLKAAPNLIAIYDFDVFLVDALVVTGRVGLVKSLGHYGNPQGNRINPEVTFESSIRCLSHLETALKTFDIVTENVGPEVIASYLRILQSSRKSLTHLKIHHPQNPMNFHQVSPLTSLKRIIFDEEVSYSAGRYFPEGTRLSQLFPSLTHFAIQGVGFGFLREPAFQDPQWGYQIKSITLQFHETFEFCIVQNRQQFPNLISMEIHGTFSSQGFKNFLLKIATYWPRLENLSACVESPLMKRGRRNCSVDSAITGFSDEVLNQLKHTSPEESIPGISMLNLVRSSTIRKLSKLKFLKLKITGDELSEDVTLEISELSHQFGFRFLPHLKLIIATDENLRGEWIKDVKTKLQPLMHLEIQIGKTNGEEEEALDYNNR